MTLVLILIGFTLIVIGVVCAHRVARASKDQPEHPVCNQCGYAAGPDADRPCPECGADLRQPGAIIRPLPDWRLVAGAVAGLTLGGMLLLILIQ